MACESCGGDSGRGGVCAACGEDLSCVTGGQMRHRKEETMNDERSTFLGTSLLVAAAVFAVAILAAHVVSMRRIDDLQAQLERVEAQLWAAEGGEE